MIDTTPMAGIHLEKRRTSGLLDFTRRSWQFISLVSGSNRTSSGFLAYAVLAAACFGTLAILASLAYERGATPLQLLPLEPPAEEPLERKLAPVVPPATDADETEYRESEGTYESDPAEPKEEADPADESEPAEPRGRRGEHSEPQESEPQEREPQESEYPDYREESNGRRGGSGLAMDEEWREPPTQEDAYYEDGSADSY
ncbi:MAG: hypothetical protein M1617_03615 [Actinobacteria bacterium]|nr:hypothetical protein [Actinomycetota bacterium]